jgi:hypothetical protein
MIQNIADNGHVWLTANDGMMLNKVGTEIYLQKVLAPTNDADAWQEVDAKDVPQRDIPTDADEK